MPRTCLEVCKIQCLALYRVRLEFGRTLSTLGCAMVVKPHWGSGFMSFVSFVFCFCRLQGHKAMLCYRHGWSVLNAKATGRVLAGKAFLSLWHDLPALHLCKYHWRRLQRLQLFRLLASNSPSPYSASSCFKFPFATCHSSAKSSWRSSWRAKSTSPMSLLAAGNVEACMLLILNHICWTSRIQTPTGSCFHRPGLVTVGKSSASACFQLRSEGAFKSRLCRLLTLSKTCKPWLSH